MIPATISTMLSTTSPVTAPPKISAGARVIFGVAALLENTPFELYTLIRSGSLIDRQLFCESAFVNQKLASLLLAEIPQKIAIMQL